MTTEFRTMACGDLPMTIHDSSPTGGLGLSVTLFAMAGSGLAQWLPLVPSLLMSVGAFCGGVAAILPAASTAANTYLEGRQQRRFAEAEFRRRQAGETGPG